MMRAMILGVLALFAAPAAAQTVGGCGTAAIGKAEAGDRVKLGSNADCFAQAKMIASAAEAVRRDRLSGMAPSMPAPPVAPTLSPSLAGIAPVDSGVKVEAHLVKAWTTGAIPKPEDGQAEGAFRFLCAPSHNAYDDPIIYPGQPGASHLHTFFGNTLADAHSSYTSLRTTGESSCNNLLNRSAYWIAAMMNGHGKVVMPDYVSIYYKRPASTAPICTIAGKACVPLPRGLRYVFGYNMQEPKKSAPAGYYWNCDGPGAVSGHFPSIGAAAKGCPVGARLGAVLSAPPCWNGMELDSKDHRSHMAWTAQDGYGHAVCPKSHPYIVPQFTLASWYTVDATLADWFLASDRMPGMAAAVPGTTLHSDWFGAWEDSVQARWTANCIEKMLSCSGGDLGDGSQLATAAGYDYPHGRPLRDPPAKVAAATMHH